MAASAAIKFTQGATTDLAGRALIGALGTPVVASNGNDAGIVYWEWEVLGTPTGSAVTPGVKSQGGIATNVFTPDVRGGYHLSLTTKDRYGAQAVDTRVFQVLELSGRIIPPFGAGKAALNFGGQLYGWQPYMEAWLKAVDAGKTWLVKSANYTIAAANEHILADLTSAWTLKLPASPVLGEEHSAKDYLGLAATNNLTIDGNGHNVEQFLGPVAATLLLTSAYDEASVVYNGSTWSLT